MSQYADQIGFAAGVLVGTRSDIVGGTPIRFGILQDAQLDFSADLKELYGQNRYAIALAPGKTKVEIKAKFAGIRGGLFNGFYFGQATTPATQILFADSEPGTVALATVTVVNGAKFLSDQGVYYASTGVPLVQVASAPTVGQYSVAAGGVYTFNVTDDAAVVNISYTYSSTSGIQIPITNVHMGVGPSFGVVLSQPFDGRQVTYEFPQCQSSKLSLPTKQDDFMISELDFMVSANIAGVIGTINTSL
jgi:hypothetical protein